MRVDIQVELRSDPKLLRAVRGLIRSYFIQSGFCEDKSDEVVLAVDEACTNAIRHAYEGRKDDILLITLRSNSACVEVEVRDAGLPAPPEHLVRKELKTPSLDDLKPHGLGVQLIYEVFDQVAFWPGEEEGNCVTMRLNQPEPKE